MDLDKTKIEITALLEKYNQEKGKKYNEDATKKRFYFVLFNILGWDVAS